MLFSHFIFLDATVSFANVLDQVLVTFSTQLSCPRYRTGGPCAMRRLNWEGEVVLLCVLWVLPLCCVHAPFADFVWSSNAPSRVRFFIWLLVQTHVHTRDVLLRKKNVN